MSASLAQRFREELELVGQAIAAVPAEWADVPWRQGGWTRKQIIGHLLDSATNNRQRFVRAAIDGQYAGPTYAQDAWVAAHGYRDQPWARLLGWWQSEHEILIAVVENIPFHALDAPCRVGDSQPVSLSFLIDDYVRHQRWHLQQLRTGLDPG